MQALQGRGILSWHSNCKARCLTLTAWVKTLLTHHLPYSDLALDRPQSISGLSQRLQVYLIRSRLHVLLSPSLPPNVIWRQDKINKDVPFSSHLSQRPYRCSKNHRTSRHRSLCQSSISNRMVRPYFWRDSRPLCASVVSFYDLLPEPKESYIQVADHGRV